jgi:CBS domain-containing protein
MSAGRICTRIVATTAPTETVRAAARRMADHEVGTLVVVAEEPEPHAVGVITDRDITIRGVAEELDLDQTPVSHLMSSPVRIVHEATPIEQALAIMGTTGTRRLVVTGHNERPVGILSLDDVLQLHAVEAESIGRLIGRQKPEIAAGLSSWS